MQSGFAFRCCFALVSILAASQAAMATDAAAFHAAKPVWPAGREKEMNLQVGFRAVIEKPAEAKQAVVLRVAAASFYRATVNGQFVAAGPARAAHGFYRIDEVDISHWLGPGRNVVAIEVAGYNVNGFYLLDQPSFCQAEVVAGGRVLAATECQPRGTVPFSGRRSASLPENRDSAFAAGPAEGKFAATVLDYRLQKVQRYSFSRPFIEFYRIKPGWDAWRRDPAATRRRGARWPSNRAGNSCPAASYIPSMRPVSHRQHRRRQSRAPWQRSAIPGSSARWPPTARR